MSQTPGPQLFVSVISAEEKTRDWNDPELPPQFNEIILSWPIGSPATRPRRTAVAADGEGC